jgi:DNA polymerase II small subunit
MTDSNKPLSNTLSNQANDSLTLSKKNAIDFLLKKDILPTKNILDMINSFQTPDDIIAYVKALPKMQPEESTIIAQNPEPQSETVIHKDVYEEEPIEKINPVRVDHSYKEHVKKRTIDDFVIHYNNRFNALRKMLQSRDLDNVTSIRRIMEMRDKETVTIIGMVYAVSESKNGHMIIQMEDRTGIIKALVMKSKDKLHTIAKNIVLDEVIAVTGTAGKEIVFVEEIYFPDIPFDKVIKTCPKEGYAVFISDIEFGSKVFLQKEWDSFMDFLIGKKIPENYAEVVPKIKYLIICGDTISGVGIYPGQADELRWTSVRDQYFEFTKYLKMIPKHIEVIICPGNHDAVRLAEPQPAFFEEFVGEMMHLPNVTLISSPGMVTIEKTDTFEGLKLLLYHGFSMPYYGNNVPEIREAGGLQGAAEKVLKFYLQRRHFAPSHGSTQFVPDIRYDPLVIDTVPDILITGHIHKIIAQNYRGVTMLNTSAWVAPSEYQGRFGLIPDNCRAVLINLQTRAIKILNFNKKEVKEVEPDNKPQTEENKTKEETNEVQE